MDQSRKEKEEEEVEEEDVEEEEEMDLEASPASQLRPLSSTEPFRTAEIPDTAGGSFALTKCSQPLETT